MIGNRALMQLCISLFPFLLVFVYFPLWAAPQTAPKTSKAYYIDHSDTFYRDNENHFAELEGNVQIIINQQHISCSQALIDEKTKTIQASGNVSLFDPKVNIDADTIIFNYETGLGTIYNGFVQSGQVVFEGKVIHKVGDDEYVIDQGQYTACTTCPSAWSFQGQTIKARIGGYAYIKSSIIRFGGVPSLWLPYLVVPLKSSRQTGLLPPTFGYASDTKLSITESLFWDMGRSQDSTWAYTQNSKWKRLGVNYRYLLDKNSKGNLDASFANEKILNSTDSDKKFLKYNSELQRINRWFIKYDQFFDLPEGFVQRTQINLASDLQFPKDFPKDTRNHGDPAMENRISLTKNTSEQHLSLDSSYYINLLKDNPYANNKDAVHRFPELKYSVVEKRLGNSDAFVNLDVNYVNFARDYYTYDDVSQLDKNPKYISNDKGDSRCAHDPGCVITRDGRYDESAREVSTDSSGKKTYAGPDQIRTGQRFDFQPTLSYPMKVGKHIELLPSATYRFTRYSFGVGENPDHDRQNLRTKLSARTSFNGIFGNLEEVQATRYKHEIQPEIILTTMPWTKESRHPFFSQSDNDQEVPFFKTTSAITDDDINGLNGLQFDYTDRLYDRKLITFVLNNKLTRKVWTPLGSDYKSIAGLKLSQSYDYNEAESSKQTKHPWSSTNGTMYVRMSQVDLYSLFKYYPYHKVMDTSERIKLSDTLGNWIQLGITHQYSINENSNDSTYTTEDYTLASGFTTKYFNLVGAIGYSQITYKVTSWQYTATFKVPGNCWGVVVSHRQLAGESDPKTTLDMYFSFDGQSSRSVSELSNFYN